MAVDLWFNDADLIRERFLLDDHKVVEVLATHGTQVGYRLMVEVHNRVMQIGHDWGRPVPVQRAIEYDLKIILQTVVVRVSRRSNSGLINEALWFFGLDWFKNILAMIKHFFFDKIVLFVIHEVC